MNIQTDMVITSTESLKSSILTANPTADLTVLEELCFLTRKHQLKWVARGSKHGAFFIMSQLSLAKGLDAEDYRKHWADKSETTAAVKRLSSESTSSLLQNPAESLPGEALKLEGERLASFKKLYQETYGESLGRINSLYIGDWLHAYSYLVQGKTETAKDFQALGSKAIETSVKQNIEEITQPVKQVTKSIIYQSGWSREDYLQRDLCYLACMSPYKLSAEVAADDYPGSRTQVRRFDLLNIQPHKTKGKIVTCYELKKDVITLEDLVMTVDAKRYIELLKDKYQTPHVKLIMVAPYGGTEEALVKCQSYDDVEIWTVRKLSLFLLEKAKKYHPTDSYFVDKVLVDENDTVKKLITPPQVVQEVAKVLPFPVKKIAA